MLSTKLAPVAIVFRSHRLAPIFDQNSAWISVRPWQGKPQRTLLAGILSRALLFPHHRAKLFRRGVKLSIAEQKDRSADLVPGTQGQCLAVGMSFSERKKNLFAGHLFSNFLSSRA